MAGLCTMNELSAVIELRGKYAVGESRYAIVDADRFDELNQFAWKAKPNANNSNVYAVRNVKGSDGVSRTIRMHRVVIGYDGDLDIDHINQNSLDNRRANLRVATRSENVKNSKVKNKVCTCKQCGRHFIASIKGSSPLFAYCSDVCIAATNNEKRAAMKADKDMRWHRQCDHCGKEFDAAAAHQVFCTESCRKAAKYRRQKAVVNHPAPSVSGAQDL